MFNPSIFNIIGEGRQPRYFDMNAIVYAINRHDHDFSKNYAGIPILHGYSKIEYSSIGTETDRGTSQLGTDNHHARQHSFITTTQKGNRAQSSGDDYDTQHEGLLQSADFQDNSIIYTKLNPSVLGINTLNLGDLGKGKIKGLLGQLDWYSSSISTWVTKINPANIQLIMDEFTPSDNQWPKIENHTQAFYKFNAVNRKNPHGLTASSLKLASLLVNLPLHSWSILGSIAPFLRETGNENDIAYMPRFEDSKTDWLTTTGCLDEYTHHNAFHVPDGLRFDDWLRKSKTLHRPLYCCDDLSSPHTNMSWRIGKSEDIRYQVHNSEYTGRYTYSSEGVQWLQPSPNMKQYLAFPNIGSPIGSFLPMLIMGPAVPGIMSDSDPNKCRYDNSIECRPYEYENPDEVVEGHNTYFPTHFVEDISYGRYQYLYNQFYLSDIPSYSKLVLVLHGMFMLPNNFSDYGLVDDRTPIIAVHLRSKDDQYDPNQSDYSDYPEGVEHDPNRHVNVYYRTTSEDVLINYSGESTTDECVAYKISSIEIPMDIPIEGGKNLINPGTYTIQVYPRMLEYTVEDTKKYGFIYFGLTHAYIRLSDIITKYVPPTKDRYDVYYTTVGQYCVWKFTPAGKQSKFFTNLIYMESDNEYNESAEQTIPEDSSWGEYTRHYHIITNKKYISTRAKATVILDHTKYYETENQAAIPYAFEDDEYIPEPGYKKSQACFVKCCNGSYDFDLKHLRPDAIKETEKQGIKLSIETDPKNIEIKHLDICMLVNNIDPNTGNKIFNYPMVFNFRPRGTVPQTHKLSLKFKFFTDNPLKNNNPVVSSEEWVKCWTGTDSGRSAYFYRDKHHYFSGNPFHELPCYEEYTFWSREREGKEDTNTFFWSDQTTPMQPANGELPEGYIFDLYNSQNHTTFGGARNQLDLLAYGIPNGYDDYSMPALRLLPRYFENNSWGYKPLIQVEDISDQIDSLFTDIPQITSQNHKLFRIQCPHIYDGYDTLKINGIIARMDFTEAEFDTLFENSQWFTLSIGIHDVNQQIYQDDHESRSDPIVEAIYITKLNED